MKTAAYTQILKRNNLTMADIARIFGSKSEHSFRSSSAFKRRIKGVCELIQFVEDNIVEKIKS